MTKTPAAAATLVMAAYIVIAFNVCSGVTRVGVTRGATDGVTLFLKKTDNLFSHRPLKSD